MLFDRVKSVDAVLQAAERKQLGRTLGIFQLTFFGIGCVIGTGIFVLVAAGAQKAGPSLTLSFAIAGLICVFAALCYAEIAAVLPVSGSAYTYSYASLGEFAAWTVGWALILEYAISASAVAVGWSGYLSGTILNRFLGVHLPAALASGPLLLGGAPGGLLNLPAVLVVLAVTALLMLGTGASARVNAVLVAIKATALLVFITVSMPHVRSANFSPFLPAGVFAGFGVGAGTIGAASTIFFAYIGFDAVSTASEESKKPQRDIPVALIGSLLFCTVVYIMVAAGSIGSIGGQPVTGPSGLVFPAGSEELARQCALPRYRDALVCSNEALAHVLREIGFGTLGNMIGVVAFVALPSVIIVLLFGQTRIFFAMARDGLLPGRLSTIHPKWKTPWIVTAMTGGAIALASAFLPVGRLADIANGGTLYAFLMVSLAVLRLRKTEPHRERVFRTPMLWLFAPLTMAGCLFLFVNLPLAAMMVLPIWGAIGITIYIFYGRRRSHLGQHSAA